ncbi:MAG: SMC-Scp complex subunit ScpB [Candidatus Paceibacterota bacterium]
MDLDAKIESVLFWKGEPTKIKKLAEIFGVSEDEAIEAVKKLEQNLAGRGLRIVVKDGEAMLGTAPEVSDIIEKLTKEELIKDLGRAGLETLSIILYRGPIARKEIDYIRGVNSNFILRNLLIRGLIEKIQNKEDQRSFLYKPTFALLQHLGVSKLEDMPEYAGVRQEIEEFKLASQELEEEDAVAKAIDEQPEKTDNTIT